MDIIKNLKDYKLTHAERIIAGYLQEKASISICVEKITNKEFLIKYLEPLTDFLIYSTAIAEPARLLKYRSSLKVI